MDFIIDFFKNIVYGSIYDAYLVIVNKLFKIIYYILTRKNISAGNFTKLIIKKIIRFYGIFLLIVSDRGSFFTSRL